MTLNLCTIKFEISVTDHHRRRCCRCAPVHDREWRSQIFGKRITERGRVIIVSRSGQKGRQWQWQCQDVTITVESKRVRPIALSHKFRILNFQTEI